MPDRVKKMPGIVVAGLKGGSGKTVVSLGIVRALSEKHSKVSVFKKGPDYIDAGWLSKAAGRPCYNLDTFMCNPYTVKESFHNHIIDSDFILVEGNRGLYDGIDSQGSTSTAELAKLLDLPILLVVDCSKATRTIAALIMGCILFDKSIKICGVILNCLAGKRHENKIRQAIESFCEIPVIGAIPRLSAKDFPERHMGLVTTEEHSSADEAINAAGKIASKYIDIDNLSTACTSHNQKSAWNIEKIRVSIPPISIDQEEVIIGILRDAAFSFYYQENLDALKAQGATLIFISPLEDLTIPKVHGIYLGGGFPETHASQLSKNISFRQQLKKLSQNNLPIYGECGGLIFLGKSISIDHKNYPMTGIIPITFELSKKPQGHGYTIAKVINDTPFYKKGEIIKGHEFRYTKVIDLDYEEKDMGFYMEKGTGIIHKKDGFCINNTFGTYTHVHALGTLSWAKSFVNKAREYKLYQQTTHI